MSNIKIKKNGQQKVPENLNSLLSFKIAKKSKAGVA